MNTTNYRIATSFMFKHLGGIFNQTDPSVYEPHQSRVHNTYNDVKEARVRGYNKRAALKLMFDYYNKHHIFSGSVDDIEDEI